MMKHYNSILKPEKGRKKEKKLGRGVLKQQITKKTSLKEITRPSGIQIDINRCEFDPPIYSLECGFGTPYRGHGVPITMDGRPINNFNTFHFEDNLLTCEEEPPTRTKLEEFFGIYPGNSPTIFSTGTIRGRAYPSITPPRGLSEHIQRTTLNDLWVPEMNISNNPHKVAGDVVEKIVKDVTNELINARSCRILLSYHDRKLLPSYDSIHAHVILYLRVMRQLKSGIVKLVPIKRTYKYRDVIAKPGKLESVLLGGSVAMQMNLDKLMTVMINGTFARLDEHGNDPEYIIPIPLAFFNHQRSYRHVLMEVRRDYKRKTPWRIITCRHTKMVFNPMYHKEYVHLLLVNHIIKHKYVLDELTSFYHQHHSRVPVLRTMAFKTEMEYFHYGKQQLERNELKKKFKLVLEDLLLYVRCTNRPIRRGKAAQLEREYWKIKKEEILKDHKRRCEQYIKQKAMHRELILRMHIRNKRMNGPSLDCAFSWLDKNIKKKHPFRAMVMDELLRHQKRLTDEVWEEVNKPEPTGSSKCGIQ